MAAELLLAPDADPAAPGAAITTALCGHWEHDGPCQWPHHTAVVPCGPPTQPDDQRRTGGPVPISIRTIFACAPGEEDALHDRVAAGLHAGQGRAKNPAGWSSASNASRWLPTNARSRAGSSAGSPVPSASP